MKKKALAILLAVLLVVALLPSFALAAGPDINTASNWVTDRTEPGDFAISGGNITFTVTENPAADSWYAWQGRGFFTGAEFGGEWSVEYDIVVTDAMLTTDNINASVWIQIDEDGGNTAASQADCVDWCIVKFSNEGAAPAWQWWDSTNGVWNTVSGVTPTAGTHTVKISFKDGTVTQSIDGTDVNDYSVGVTEAAPVYLIVMGRSYGDSFGVSVGVPEIVYPANMNDASEWVTDRTEPGSFTVSGGKVSFTVTENPAADSWYAWQGRGIFTKGDFAGEWAVEYDIDVTDAMLTTDNINASVWIQIDEDGGNTAASQADCVDWCIVKYSNEGAAPAWQWWDSTNGVWNTVSAVTPTAGTHAVKVAFKDGTVTQSIDGTAISSYSVGVNETAPVYIIVMGRSYGDSFGVSVGVPTIDYTITPPPPPLPPAPVTYALTFATDGGTEIPVLYVTAGTVVDLADYAPEKDGFTFVGWFADEELTEAVTSVTVSAAKTVYAKWDKVPCDGGDNCVSHPYADVDTAAWYHEAVDYVIENGLMQGIGDGKFDPLGVTTRAQLVMTLYRLEGEPAVAFEPIFDDVAEGDWYADAVMWANSTGIACGYGNGEFGAEDALLREQAAVILYRYAVYKGLDVSVDPNTNFLSFNDFWDVSDYATAAMEWALTRGIIEGYDWDILPQGDAIRVQTAAMLFRFCENVL